ncbi:hypothetical protein BDZ91DRAFT_472483 [Kalaharituber pfeilii]|nr:hypothetical protein BDZ91DRAFT_472483 [Kalaharituber pfeilii]
MAVPFLFLIPAAIFSARYKKFESPRQAIQWHFILNTTTVLFLTVGFLAGWFAVNKGEWGGNPHHIIGVTIYGGIVLQALFGIFLRQREKNKLRKLGEVGLKSMLHAWFGRGIFLLGLAQIPLGLYLYGSPLVLFIIYAALTFVIFCIWFIFEYVYSRRRPRYEQPGVGSVRGGQARSDGSSHRRNASHSGVSYTEMTETSHTAPTSTTPGTLTRTSYDGTEYVSHDSGFGNEHNHSNNPNMPVSPKMSRLNRLSQSLGNRFRRGVSSLEGRVIGGTPISLDTSTRPPTGSTANQLSGGLHAPPNNQNRPALSSIGGQIASVGALDQHHYRRNGAHSSDDPLKDSNRPSSGSRVELPGSSVPQTTTNTTTISPVSPVSSSFIQVAPIPRPQSDVSSLSSDRPGAKYAGGHLFSPLLPPIKQTPQQDVPMPPSPLGDSYLSDEGPASPPPKNKYPPLLLSNPPKVPLPMPPEPPRRSRSHHRAPSDASTQPDAVIRIPLSRNSDVINVPAGELVRNNLPPGEQPQVSVQVHLDRLGRSVTVRRVPEDEATLLRQKRQRERAAKAEERERAIDREAKRKSEGEATMATGSGSGGHTNVALGSTAAASKPAPRPVSPERSNDTNPRTSLLHRHSYSEDDGYTSEEGYAPVGVPVGSAVGSRVSGGGGAGRESVVSAGAQTDDAEAEEKIRERRRRKRREERKEGGLTSAELQGGTYYGAAGEAGGSGVTRNVEWT